MMEMNAWSEERMIQSLLAVVVGMVLMVVIRWVKGLFKETPLSPFAKSLLWTIKNAEWTVEDNHLVKKVNGVWLRVPINGWDDVMVGKVGESGNVPYLLTKREKSIIVAAAAFRASKIQARIRADKQEEALTLVKKIMSF